MPRNLEPMTSAIRNQTGLNAIENGLELTYRPSFDTSLDTFNPFGQLSVLTVRPLGQILRAT